MFDQIFERSDASITTRMKIAAGARPHLAPLKLSTLIEWI
jgi:hypothetical protein